MLCRKFKEEEEGQKKTKKPLMILNIHNEGDNLNVHFCY